MNIQTRLRAMSNGITIVCKTKTLGKMCFCSALIRTEEANHPNRKNQQRLHVERRISCRQADSTEKGRRRECWMKKISFPPLGIILPFHLFLFFSSLVGVSVQPHTFSDTPLLSSHTSQIAEQTCNQTPNVAIG